MPIDQNTRTLIATFENYSQAQQASRDLLEAGIPAEAIRIDSEKKTAGAGAAGASTGEEEHESIFSKWWHELFGESHDRSEREGWERGIAKGSSLLSVTVPAERADIVADLLNRDGAIDLDRSSTGAAMQGAMPDAQCSSPASRGGVRVYSRTVTEPVEEWANLQDERGSQVGIENPLPGSNRQESAPATPRRSRRVNTSIAGPGRDRPMGGGFTPGSGTLAGEATAGSAIQDYSATDFTADYRSDFEKTYGRTADFEKIRPAYDFGYRMAESPKYQDRGWEESLEDLESDYRMNDSRTDWDQVKSAVRYGWEKRPRSSR